MCEIKDCFLSEVGYWIDKKKSIFKRNVILPTICKEMIREERNNIGIFTSAYSYDREIQNEAYLYGDLYLDFDSDNFELVRADAIKALSYIKVVFRIDNVDEVCQVFFSGNKGVHIMISAEVLGIEPSKDLNETFKMIAETISNYTENKTVDLRIYDKKRMFRMPNSVHESTGLYKVYLTVDELRNEDYQNIKEKASMPRIIPEKYRLYNRHSSDMFMTFKERAKKKVLNFDNVKSNGTLKYTPPCIKEIIENGVTSGSRNNTIAILASFLKASGKDLESSIKEISQWNSEKNSMPTPEAELKKTIRSMYLTDRNFGCSAIKSLDLCSKEKCRFRKE